MLPELIFLMWSFVLLLIAGQSKLVLSNDVLFAFIQNSPIDNVIICTLLSTSHRWIVVAGAPTHIHLKQGRHERRRRRRVDSGRSFKGHPVFQEVNSFMLNQSL